MKDFQIRQILHNTELLKFHNDNDSKVVEELDLLVAKARIDLAVINGSFHGYEIKSASDTLQRLPSQLLAYTYVFDYLTIITEEKYFQKIIDTTPDWIAVATCSKNNQEIEIKRQGYRNTSTNGFHLAQLLWRDELLEVIKEQNLPCKKKYRNWVLCEAINANLDIETISQIVRKKIKARKNWKPLKNTVH